MPEFLLEIGLEEIPARMIASAQAELARRIEETLTRQRLLGLPARVSSYSTPRRLAVRVEGVLAQQPDVEEQLTGPSWKAAFPGGEPGPAAQAFAKKAGVPVTALEKITTPKGEYAAATVHRPGQSAATVLTESLPAEISALTWPKTMYWRPNKPERFVRPLRWLLCLLDETVVPLQFAGISAGHVSYGHRVLHGEQPVVVSLPSDYLSALEAAFVLAGVAERRQRIRKALDATTRSILGARWREDEALVEQVTHLTEWPSVLLGDFQPEYLALPEEVLVTVMRDHQKYFALEDERHALAPKFLTVLNTQVDAEGTAIIRHGNERVLRARFNDARFFWNYDQKILLTERVEKLKTVTFQRDLGSYFAKTENNLRMARALAAAVVAHGIRLDQASLEQAMLLAKTDLTTELVKEFTELQGIVGGLYARAQGLGETVAQAIYHQYLPAGMEDPIPPTVEGQLLGLSDRLATIAEMFAIGLEPSGSKDPFALRRAANGVIKILAESRLPLTVEELESMTLERWPGATALSPFLKERIHFYLREVRGYAYDVVNAVLSTGLTTITDAVARAEALTRVRGSDDLLAISTAFKRIKNILRQAEEKQDKIGDAVVEQDLTEAAEQNLYAEAVLVAPQVEALRAQQQYLQALERIATLRPVIDTFFDKVMVMAPEPHVRRNRLALIASVLSDFSRIADFSEIVPT
ncbi:MAG TPA: glycine--tRNA ligase subunit beta [Acidobacteriaceae bacterium]|nr:glycine--tRNA ligase subunit beta [Acidobacteriaceae bacterium]